MFKFNDDPTINKFGIIVLLGQIWMYVQKTKLRAINIISLALNIIA